LRVHGPEGCVQVQPVPAIDVAVRPLGTASLTDAQRYARYLRLGRVSDVSALSGDLGTDPLALVSLDVTSDARRISSTHYEYDARSLTATSDPAGRMVSDSEQWQQ